MGGCSTLPQPCRRGPPLSGRPWPWGAHPSLLVSRPTWRPEPLAASWRPSGLLLPSFPSRLCVQTPLCALRPAAYGPLAPQLVSGAVPRLTAHPPRIPGLSSLPWELQWHPVTTDGPTHSPTWTLGQSHPELPSGPMGIVLCSRDPEREGWPVWSSLRGPSGTNRCSNPSWRWDSDPSPLLHSETGSPPHHTAQSLAPHLHSGHSCPCAWPSAGSVRGPKAQETGGLAAPPPLRTQHRHPQSESLLEA